MNAIETHQLTRSFGALVAVDQLTLTIPAGNVFGFLGPNGAGKTTTVRMLVALIAPTSGSAIVAGQISSQIFIALLLVFSTFGRSLVISPTISLIIAAILAVLGIASLSGVSTVFQREAILTR